MSPPTATPLDAEPAPSSTRWALAGLSMSMLLPSLGTSVANVALPTLARAFDAPFRAVQWVVLAYLLAVTTLIVGVGRLGDLVGRRRLLLAGIALFSGASLLCGVAPTLALLVAARALQGIGAAVMMSLTIAFVGEAVPRERVGSAMGLLGTMSAVGTAMGPALGGLLIQRAGWPALFLVNLPLGALALGLASRFLPDDRQKGTMTWRGFDGAGSFLLASTLGAYALAVTIGRSRSGALQTALLLAAVGGGVLFVRVEARAASPLVRLAIVRDRMLSASLAAGALVSTVMMATLVVGPFYLSRALGLEPSLVGLVLSVGPVVTAAAGVPAGRVADRVGSRRTTIAGLAAMALGAALLSALPPALGVPAYAVPIVVLTVGYALFQTANNAGVMTAVRAEERGVVSGLLNLARNLGLVTGASAMGAVFAAGAGTADVATAPPRAVAVGMRITFLLATALMVAASALVTRARPPRAAAGPAAAARRPATA